MIRTVISQTDLGDKAREIGERVLHGEMAVVESLGKEQIVLLDAMDFRLLQALAACASGPSGLDEEVSRDARVIRSYLAADINLGKAAEELGLSRFELLDHFRRLGVPLRLGPSSIEEALSEIAVLQAWGLWAATSLAGAYAEDEPEYSLDLIKEPNPDYVAG